jgi:hypothetical protein
MDKANSGELIMINAHEVTSANFINEVQGGKTYFANTSKIKFSEKHRTILGSLVKSVLSSLLMEDVIIKVDLSPGNLLDGVGEAYRLGKSASGTPAYGFAMKAKALKDVVGDDGRVDRACLKQASEIIAHELVHCKQYHEGWFVVSLEGALWKGELQNEKGQFYENMQYRKRPWEAMAFAAEAPLGKAAVQDLIGQAIISVEEGMYVPRTDVEKARAAMFAIRSAERAEQLKAQFP